ncbi:MAG: ABC-F family ATP-binding cassette domain-containing protein [Candidatus Hydrogenedentes bacterium]|nr:ABC-F family ATP-binding cassette domain-containing protein [Candidatus Hydrogenedentota bacterium]
MSYIRLDNVEKRFAGRPIVQGVNLRIEEGDKVGLIGRNGAGKSTLFKLMLGDLEPDSGAIERMRRARVACLAQLPDLRKTDTLFDVVMHSFADLLDLERRLAELEDRMGGGDESALSEYSAVQEEFQRRGGYEFRVHAKKVLHGLGFSLDDFNLHVGALSGGQRTRLMLALVLLQDADLLLLDEPENHLDLEAREWLEQFLKDCKHAFVIISHDRRMLTAVTNRIIEVERGGVRSHSGNYETFAKNKAVEKEQQQAAFERQQEQIAKEEAWIDRFRYKATKAAAVQSRIKRLDKLERIDAPVSDQATAKFNLGEVVRSGALVLEAKSLSMAYGDLQLYDDLSFTVERGERIGIIGPNGTGKTTLLRHIAGRLNGGSGSVSLGHKVSLGYYDQHHEGVNPGSDIFTEISRSRPDMRPEQVRTFMGRFLFTGEDVFKPIASLSGGELSRVALAKLILAGANLILLDEPTNHLDIASREALEDALSSFPGSIVMVSHDRTLIDKLVEKLIIIERGRATVHLGNYTHYRWKVADVAMEAAPKSTADVLKIRRDKKAPKSKEEQKVQRKRRNQLEGLERDIAEMEEMIAQIEGKFASVDSSDFEKTRQLGEEYEGLKKDLGEMYAEWERQAEELSGT